MTSAGRPGAALPPLRRGRSAAPVETSPRPGPTWPRRAAGGASPTPPTPSTGSGPGPRRSPTRCGRVTGGCWPTPTARSPWAHTHDLVISLLSVDLRERSGDHRREFHSLRRRLATGWRRPGGRAGGGGAGRDPGERLAAAVDDRTCLVGVSAVLFMSKRIVPDLAVVPACQRHGERRWAYRLGPVPFPIHHLGLSGAVGHRWRVQVPPARRGQRLPQVPQHADVQADRHRLVRRVRRPRRRAATSSSPTDRRRAGSPAAPRPGEQLPVPASSASSTSTAAPGLPARGVPAPAPGPGRRVRRARPAGAHLGATATCPSRASRFPRPAGAERR